MALNPQSFSVPFHLTGAVDANLEGWRSEDKLARLWKRDASLWTSSDEADWLGWLDAPGQWVTGSYDAISHELRAARFSDILLLGMGGSVLCPALFSQVFGPQPGFPRLRVLDSLDPSDIRGVESSLDLEHTLIVVSSKSGSTLESRLLMAYFVERIGQAVGHENCGQHFVAITDPGSSLAHTASERGFRQVFDGRPDIGGRFSAFSSFGLVPLALMGVDVDRFVAETMPMVDACGPRQSVLGCPGVLLGVILAVLARHGHDKVTFVSPPSISRLSDWLEQLLAESTGKSGVGLIPVTGEEHGPPEAYGDDRLFVYLRPDWEPADVHEAPIAALEESGQPVVRIRVPDAFSIGQELFRWEIATAVAGSVLGVHPFDQPDVESSKSATRELMSQYERTGQLVEETPTVEDDGLKIFFDPGSRGAPLPEGEVGLSGCVRAFLSSLGDRHYGALLAYAPEDGPTLAALERLRHVLARTSTAPITRSHGPRYLHSSGQLHKGGPNNGVFLILVSEEANDLPVPGHPYSFGVVRAAQARGDAGILAAGGRCVLRIVVTGRFEEGVERIVREVSTTPA